MALLGGTFEAQIPLALALAGAPMGATIERVGGFIREPTVPNSFFLPAYSCLVMGAARTGARTYLAVRGGWLSEVVLGSRSSERRLAAGEVLDARPTGFWPTRSLRDPAWSDGPERPLRVMPGFDAMDIAHWEGARFRVAPESDRMGLRLEGPVPSIKADAERRSVPVAPGSVQVAGDRLIVLGVAGGTMGGYPHVAQVIAADLDHLGQARPGDVVRFVPITRDGARRLDRERRESLRRLLLRVSMISSDRLGMPDDGDGAQIGPGTSPR
jgi:antagonist of KipI